MTAAFFQSESAPKEVKQALLELLESDANFRIALRAALRSTTPSPFSNSTQLALASNGNSAHSMTSHSAPIASSLAATRDGSKSYLSALAAVSKRKNSLQRSAAAAPTSPAPAPNSLAPTPPSLVASSPAVAGAAASALSPKQKVLRRVKRRSVSRASPTASPSTTATLPPPPLPSDDDSSRSSQNDNATNTNNDDDDAITTNANSTNASAGTPIAVAKSLFDDDDASTASDSDGAPLPPPAFASASNVATPATATIAAIAAGVLDHAPPPLPDSVTPPLPVLGPTPPLPPDRSVPPVLPPVTSPQETLTQTTSTTVARSCSGCALSIAPEEKHYEFRMSDEEVFYHVACFACIDCGMALEPETFKTRGAAVYCVTHFAQRFFPRCGGCNEPITTDVFSVALGKSWHKGHFKCFSCGKQLQTDFVADELQRPFCDAECFDEFDDGDDEVEDDNDGDDVN